MSHEPTATERRRRLRWAFQPRQMAVLTVVWLVLVGEVNLVTVVGGLLIAWLVTVVFPLPPITWDGRLRPWGMIVLVARLLADLATSSVKLALVAFSRRMPRPGIVRVPLLSDSDLYQVNTAELASVVPGTIVVDARRRDRLLYLHVFDLPDPSRSGEVVHDTLMLEKRVLDALGSRAERQDHRERMAERTGTSGTNETHETTEGER